MMLNVAVGEWSCEWRAKLREGLLKNCVYTSCAIKKSVVSVRNCEMMEDSEELQSDTK